MTDTPVELWYDGAQSTLQPFGAKRLVTGAGRWARRSACDLTSGVTVRLGKETLLCGKCADRGDGSFQGEVRGRQRPRPIL
jgi:hypothetical protein